MILTNIDSITFNREPISDNEVSNTNFVDDSLEEGTFLRFSQTLQKYLEVSVGNDTYNLTNYDKIQITDTININYPNTGGYLLQNYRIGLQNAMIKLIMIKYKIIFNRQKQSLQQVIREQSYYLVLVKVLCRLRQVLLIMVIMFLSALNEQILYRFLI